MTNNFDIIFFALVIVIGIIFYVMKRPRTHLKRRHTFKEHFTQILATIGNTEATAKSHNEARRRHNKTIIQKAGHRFYAAWGTRKDAIVLYLGLELPKPETAAAQQRAGKPIKTLPSVIIRRRSYWDQLGLSLGLNKLITPYDAFFQNNLYVEGDEKSEAVNAILQTTGFRNTLRNMLQKEVIECNTNLQIHPGALELAYQLEDPMSFNDKWLEEKCKSLLELLHKLPPVETIPQKAEWRGGMRFVTFLCTIAMIVAILFWNIDSLYPPLWGNSLITHMTPIFIPTITIVLGFIVFFSVRKTHGLRTFLLSVPFGLMLSFALSYGSVELYNGYQDTSFETIETYLLRKDVSRQEDIKTYTLTFKGWEGKPSSFKVDTSSSHYKEAVIGDAYEITYGQGRLQVPWLKSYTWLRRKPKKQVK